MPNTVYLAQTLAKIYAFIQTIGQTDGKTDRHRNKTISTGLGTLLAAFFSAKNIRTSLVYPILTSFNVRRAYKCLKEKPNTSPNLAENASKHTLRLSNCLLTHAGTLP